MKSIDVGTLLQYAMQIKTKDDLYKIYRNRHVDERWPDVLLCDRDWRAVLDLVAAYKEYQESAKQWHETELELRKKVRELENYIKELGEYLARLKRRVKGLQNAVRKWRVKAGVDEPGEEPELVMAERKRIRTGKNEWQWRYYEHYALPVEKNAHLAREAWTWLEKCFLKSEGNIERVYFHERYGWVAMIHVKW